MIRLKKKTAEAAAAKKEEEEDSAMPDAPKEGEPKKVRCARVERGRDRGRRASPDAA